MSGTYIQYVDRKFTPATLELIFVCNKIIEEYEAQGFTLTVRQLYYQLVARGVLENVQANYNRVSSVISDARIAGLISWTAIEDRNRSLKGIRHYTGPAQALQSVLGGYKLDLWANQQFRPEVWVEKAALESVIGGICNRLRVDFFAQRGYNSQSAQWEAGRRFARYISKGQIPIVFHLGDHDPSGIDMTEDNRGRLSMFAQTNIIVQRLALNWDQVQHYKPVPNPAKTTDSRFKEYRKRFGDESWELDALDPSVIQELIRVAVMQVRNEDRWQEALEEETTDKRVLESMIEQMEGKTEPDEED